MPIVDEESRKGLLINTARNYRKPLQNLLISAPYSISHWKATYLSGAGNEEDCAPGVGVMTPTPDSDSE